MTVTKFLLVALLFNLTFMFGLLFERTTKIKCQINLRKPRIIEPFQDSTSSFFSQHIDSTVQLPFGSILLDFDTTQYYMNLIGSNMLQPELLEKKPSYPLPEILKIVYVKFDSTDNYYCKNGKLIDSLFRFSNYQYQLPDYGNLKSYYITGISYGHEDYNAEMKMYCKEYALWIYGYLLFYNETSKLAIVSPIFFVDGQDGYVKGRKFYIDNNFNIFLVDFAEIGNFDEEAEVSTEHSSSKVYQLKVSATGEYEIIFSPNWK